MSLLRHNYFASMSAGAGLSLVCIFVSCGVVCLTRCLRSMCCAVLDGPFLVAILLPGGEPVCVLTLAFFVFVHPSKSCKDGTLLLPQC